jgi:arsenate reductase
MKTRVLFVCIHNSARSQMAEAFLNHQAGDRFEAESAGIEPGKINPIVVKTMQEIGIDLTGRPTKSVDSMIARGPSFDYVVTVCDETSAERCPIFPGAATRLHWPFADPSSFQGAEEERLARTRIVRDEIKSRIDDWATHCRR